MKKPKFIFNPANAGILGILHVILGASVLFGNLGVIIWILCVIPFLLIDLLNAGKEEIFKLVVVLAYISGIEILARISKTSPWVPYEFGKYSYICFLILGLIKFKQQKATPGFWVVVLSLPSLLLIPWEGYRDYFVNSFLGIFLLGLVSHLLYGKILSKEQLKVVFLNYLYGTIGVAVAVIIKTPELSDIKFKLSANFDTSGGFGSNQVATVLGAGFMLVGLAFLLRIRLFPLKFTDLGMMVIFFFRSVLTFSRGGVFVGFLGVLAAYIVPGSTSKMRKVKVIHVMTILLLVFGVFYRINDITGSAVLNRYKGETQGTLEGHREASATTFSSGRFDLFLAEIKIFATNPILGVGPGGGYEYREKHYGQKSASHTEVSRLAAEHGVLGVAIVLIFLFFPIIWVLKLRNKYQRMLSTAFFTLAIFTSFHGAMRTTITPLFWALGCMRFPEEKELILTSHD